MDLARGRRPMRDASSAISACRGESWRSSRRAAVAVLAMKAILNKELSQ
jgi:hypothetical protein